MSRSIFAEASGSYSADIIQLAKGGLSELVPYKMISRNDLRQGYYIVKKQQLTTMSQQLLVIIAMKLEKVVFSSKKWLTRCTYLIQYSEFL